MGRRTTILINKEGKMDNMSRSEHLAWCKKRALQYVDEGDLGQAFISMGSDLNKHPETAGHSGIQLGVMLQIAGQLNSQDKMRKFIDGFN